MYGGKNFLTNQVNNATKAIGQAGSTFKPFALAAGIEKVSFDREALRSFLDVAPPDRVLPGSALASALAIALAMAVPDPRTVGRALSTMLANYRKAIQA